MKKYAPYSKIMVTGNFALMAGINPIEVHDGILPFTFGHEWVELPNTFGMVNSTAC